MVVFMCQSFRWGSDAADGLCRNSYEARTRTRVESYVKSVKCVTRWIFSQLSGRGCSGLSAGLEADALKSRARPPVAPFLEAARDEQIGEAACEPTNSPARFSPLLPVGEQFGQRLGVGLAHAALIDPLPSASSASKYSSVARPHAGGRLQPWRCQAAALHRPRQNAVTFGLSSFSVSLLVAALGRDR
jgi:hypothetical protein